ncbi:hypothetical protein MMYC01_208586 [Madurella mycetomatis]|uniref:Uncharacterized protein n=1 Tax=Madurella mycetomatis TaxID=100816 RepID=A0A175VXJ6_9PEZI|nr:hypothetical protein MMYC01_208586 [Madurella mycetomatis]
MAFSRLWITSFAVLGLTANIVFLIGCISPATRDIALYRVNVTSLADELQRLAMDDGGNKTVLLRPPELATYWYWGMSGICDNFEMTGETRCRWAFSPTQNLISILEESLRDRLGNDQEQRTNAIVASWNSTLNNINPARLAAKEAKFAAQSKASAALAILASVLDAATPLLALCLQHASHKRVPYLAPCGSALMALAAGTLAVLSMRDSVHSIVDSSGRGGPAIIILFVGAAIRVLSCGAAGRSSSRGNKHTGLPEFGEPEWRCIDFTYDDRPLQMLQMLGNAGVSMSPQWSVRTRYHLEVKSTPVGCDAKRFGTAAITPSAFHGEATVDLRRLERMETLSSEVGYRESSPMRS